MTQTGRMTMLFSLILLAFGLAGAQVKIAGDGVVIGDDTGADVIYVGDDSAYLGVQVEEETEHEEGGARITDVVDDSPAEKGGLEQGDIIVSFGGATVRGPLSLTKKIREHDPGESVSIIVIRGGKKKSFDIELGDRSSLWEPLAYTLSPEFNEQLQKQLEKYQGLLENQQFEFDDLGDRLRMLGDCDEGDCGIGSYSVWFGKPKLGVQLVETTPELRRHLGGGEDAGVLVSKVLSGTPAEAAGIRVGDLIVSVGGEAVADTADLRSALADKTGESFEVEVIRDGRSMTLEVTIPDPDEDVPTGPRAYLAVPLPAPAPVPTPTVEPMAAPAPPAMPAPPAPEVMSAPPAPEVMSAPPAPEVMPAPPAPEVMPAPPAPEAVPAPPRSVV